MGTAKASGINQPQLLFFSTEVPAHVLDYVAQYMTQPTKALVKGHELALKGTLQFFKYLTVEDEEWRLELLCELLEDSGANRAVVFCNQDDSVSQVVRKIRERQGTAIGLVWIHITFLLGSALCWYGLRNHGADMSSLLL
jgi:translation initiation factor 4A